jgi:hypothetical protein
MEHVRICTCCKISSILFDYIFFLLKKFPYVSVCVMFRQSQKKIFRVILFYQVSTCFSSWNDYKNSRFFMLIFLSFFSSFISYSLTNVNFALSIFCYIKLLNSRKIKCTDNVCVHVIHFSFQIQPYSVFSYFFLVAAYQKLNNK